MPSRIPIFELFFDVQRCIFFHHLIFLQMHLTLEARLVAAEIERKAAEQEKLQKEVTARKALAEQEVIMDKVVKEEKLLQEEAEENSKVATFSL